MKKEKLENFGARLLTNETASGLLESVNRLAQKAGMTKTPDIYYIEKIPGFGNLGYINAAAVDKDKILLTKGILECFDNTNLNKTTDQRLEAIIGHEMDHCMKYNKTIAARTLPLLLMPLVGAIAYHIYSKVKDKKKEKQEEAVNEEANTLQANVIKENGAPAKTWQSKAIKAGKYLASALLGLGVGILISRHYSNKYEWEADAFSKKLMESGKPLAEGLGIIEKETLKHIKQEGLGDVPLWKMLLASVLHAHPKTSERQAALLR